MDDHWWSLTTWPYYTRILSSSLKQQNINQCAFCTSTKFLNFYCAILCPQHYIKHQLYNNYISLFQSIYPVTYHKSSTLKSSSFRFNTHGSPSPSSLTPISEATNPKICGKIETWVASPEKMVPFIIPIDIQGHTSWRRYRLLDPIKTYHPNTKHSGEVWLLDVLGY